MVGEKDAESDFFTLNSLLEKIGLLPSEEAAVYAEAVRKGYVTTADAARVSHQTRSAAGVILHRLAEQGFVRERVRDATTKGGRGHAQMFSVIPPKVALQEKIGMFEYLRELVERLDEHLEMLATGGEQDEDVWIVHPPSLVSTIVAKVGTAAEGVEIVSNNCDWIDGVEVLTALGSAKKRGVRVTVYASSLGKRDGDRLKTLGAFVKRIAGAVQPFLLVDRRMLFVALRMNSIDTGYGALQTANRYLIEKHSAMIDVMNRKKKVKK